jgi:predicted MFS family arabinose efflux permease
LKTVFSLYRNAYGGLSPAAWMLALVMFINRSGSMVIPFLSVYLTGSLGFSLPQTGIILSLFGVGSMIGSVLGGWLADRVGPFLVQFLSLTIGGLFFLLLSALTTFESLAIGILLLSITAECLRPANSASVALYSKPENVTRSFSLNRMALNLGFSIGPALGGVLATISYRWLFIADGITCMLAGLVFFAYFRRRRPNPLAPVTDTAPGIQPVKALSPYRDLPFLVFLIFSALYAVIFFQLFNTLPLYYREVYALSEFSIGLLLGFNGLLVFLFEMITVHVLEKRVQMWAMVVIGTLLAGISYVLFNLAFGLWVLILAIVLLTFSEIFAMPFMVTYSVNRAGAKNRGTYIGLYTLAFSSAFILAPFSGTRIIAASGFATLWWIAGITSVFTALGFYLTMRQRKPLPAAQPAKAV